MSRSSARHSQGGEQAPSTSNSHPPLPPLLPPACQNRCERARMQTPSEHDGIYSTNGKERRNLPRNCQPTDTRLNWSIIKMIMNSIVTVTNGVVSLSTHTEHTQTSLYLALSSIFIGTYNACVCVCVCVGRQRARAPSCSLSP